MQIIDNTYFNKNNGLNIPLSVDNPVSYPNQSTPNGLDSLNNLCTTIEKSILLNAIGLSLYNEFKALTTITIEDIGNERWKKLVQGDEYDDKFWIGLQHDNSLIANKIYDEYLTQNNNYLAVTGVSKVNTENSQNLTPKYKIASANQSFIKQYQGDYLCEPMISGNFIDWFGNDNIEKSLYGYLIDKKLDFPEWNPSVFKIYETKNSFGI